MKLCPDLKQMRQSIVASLLVSCSSTGATTLSEAVDLAFARFPGASDSSNSHYRTNAAAPQGWLAADPYLEASFINSQPAEGTDEAEIALNIPIKSASQRTADQAVIDLLDSFRNTSSENRRWRLSGYIRERVWGYRIADIELEFARRQLSISADLLSRAAQLSGSGAVSQYQYLIAQQLHIDSKIAVTGAEAARSTALEAFTLMTGLNSIPTDIVEDAEVGQPDFASHPSIAQLDRNQRAQEAITHASAPGRANWNLALIARNFESPGLSEEQFGIAIQVPINFMGTRNVSNQANLWQQRRAYQLQRDQQLQTLRSNWRELIRERAALAQETDLLERSMEIAESVGEQILLLSKANELESEMLMNRSLDLLRREKRLHLVEVLLGRNSARINQLSGITL